MSFGIQAGIPQSAIDRYTVTVRDGVTYIEGSPPMSHAAALMSTAEGEQFMSTRIAQLTHTTLAWGTREALDAAEASLVAERKRIHANEPPIKQWLAYGERGQSSDAMAHALWADRPRGWIVSHEPTAYPSDPDDLRRCLLLLDMVPELVPRMPLMAEVSPEWAALVGQWAAITAQFHFEAGPDWRTEPKDAPRTFKIMSTVIEGALK